MKHSLKKAFHGVSAAAARLEKGLKGLPQEVQVGLFLFSLLLIAYYPLVSGDSTLKWDALDCYLPWRWFVAEALRNGIFPLWNPYQHLGYPIYADLRSVFSVEPWLVSLLGGYSVGLLHFIFLFYLWLGGMGIFRLSAYFMSSKVARVVSAIAYMLSGYFVAHGQELFGLTAGALMPWVLFYFIRLQRQKSFGDVWKTALFVFLLLTGGYQALSIILLYLLVFVFLATLLNHLRQHDRDAIKRLLWVNVLTAVVVSVLLAALAVSWLQARPYVARMSGISLQDAWFMPFSPQSLLSLITPFPTIGNPEFWNTDVSMNNLYFGLTLIGFAFVGMLAKPGNLLFRIVVAWGAVCLLASMGAYTPVREWFYRYVPLMNLFRMSAWFSWFALLALVLAAGRGVEAFSGNFGRYWQILRLTIGLLFVALLTVFLLHLKDFSFTPEMIFSHHKVAEASLGHRFAFNALTQLLFLVLLSLLLLNRYRFQKSFVLLLVMLVSADLVFAVRLNFYGTVGSEFTAQQVEDVLQRAPRAYPLPDIHTPLSLSPDNQRKTAPLWRNTHIFTRTVSAEGFNSFRLDSYETLTGKHPELFKAILANPLIYFSADIHPWKDSARVSLGKATCFVDDEVYASLSKDLFAYNQQIRLKQFYPGHMAAGVFSDGPALLVVSQALFPGWKALVDGHPADLLRINGFQMGLIVPSGRHEVVLRYQNPALMRAFGFSVIVFFLVLAAVLYYSLKGRLRLFLALFLPALLYGMEFYIWYGPHARQSPQMDGVLRLIQQMGDRSALLITSGGNPYIVDSLAAAMGLPLYGLHLGPDPELQLQVFDSALQRQRPAVVYYLRGEAFRSISVEDLLRMRFPAFDTLYSEGEYLLLRFHQQGKIKALYEIQLSPAYDSTLAAELDPQGILAFRIDSLRRGSPPVRFSVSASYQGRTLRVVAGAHLLLSPGAGATLYIQVSQGRQVVLRKSLSTREVGFPALRRGWLAQTAEIQLSPSGAAPLIEAYLWIDGNLPLWAEDLQMGIYP
jgi:hypothetical protein